MKTRTEKSQWACSALTLLVLSLYVILNTSEANASEAQEALKRGLFAAKQADWNLAIKYFEEAQAQSQNKPVPEILFNLALAHDRRGNSELIAIPWYHAYLAVSPESPNAAPAKERIFELILLRISPSSLNLLLLKIIKRSFIMRSLILQYRESGKAALISSNRCYLRDLRIL